jgi:hypothetical protein
MKPVKNLEKLQHVVLLHTYIYRCASFRPAQYTENCSQGDVEQLIIKVGAEILITVYKCVSHKVT